MPTAATGPLRALAIDVDGTLLDPNHAVTAESRRAVQALRSADALPVITTSRHPAGVAAIVNELGLEGQPIVTCQGAVWGHYDRHGRFHPQFTQRVPSAGAQRLTTLARRSGLGVSWYYATRWLAEHGNSMVEQEERITGVAAHLVEVLDDDWPSPFKIAVTAPPGKLRELAELQSVLPAGLAGATSRPDYLEVVADGVSKWSALQRVCQWHGVPLTEVAAIGDGNNDLEMIENAAVGIAMGHASARLRAVADWIAPDNSHEGFAAAVTWLLRRSGDR